MLSSIAKVSFDENKVSVILWSIEKVLYYKTANWPTQLQLLYLQLTPRFGQLSLRELNRMVSLLSIRKAGTVCIKPRVFMVLMWSYSYYIDPLGRPTVTAGSDHCFCTCHPFVRPSFPTFQNIQAKTMFAWRDCGSGRVDHWWHLSCKLFIFAINI